MKIKIDPEFEALIKPLTDIEFEQLEQSILAEGLRDNLVLWKKEDVLLDGHHRVKICKKHGIAIPESKKTKIDLKDRGEAKFWIAQNQFARRNLNKLERCKLALKIESQIEAKAKEKLKTHTKEGYLKSNKADAVDTLKELAKIADVGRDFMYRYRKVMKEADEIILGLFQENYLSVYQAQSLIKEEDFKKRIELISNCILHSLKANELQEYFESGNMPAHKWFDVEHCPLDLKGKGLEDCKECKYFEKMVVGKYVKNTPHDILFMYDENAKGELIIAVKRWILCSAEKHISYSPAVKRFMEEWKKISGDSGRKKKIHDVYISTSFYGMPKELKKSELEKLNMLCSVRDCERKGEFVIRTKDMKVYAFCDEHYKEIEKKGEPEAVVPELVAKDEEG